MSEQKIGDLKCIVCRKSNRTKDMCWPKRKQRSFQWLALKYIGLAEIHLLPKYICFKGYVPLLTVSQKVQLLNAWKGNFGECFACS